MSVACVRLLRRPSVVLGTRRYATPSQNPRTTVPKEHGGPVFQYAGKHRRPKDKVFVWGFSYTGALGIPSFVVPDSGRKNPRKYQLTPYRLETEQKISSAACGYGFTLLSSTTQDLTKVWGMGLNKDSQLGFQRSQRDRQKSYDYVLEPSPVSLPLARPQETRVVQVACGRAHSLLLTDSEGVFSLGNNAYGQCGRKIVEDEIYSGSHVVHKIEGFDSRVVQVACGQDHSLFLTETGKVYACGWGADGQTGQCSPPPAPATSTHLPKSPFHCSAKQQCSHTHGGKRTSGSLCKDARETAHELEGFGVFCRIPERFVSPAVLSPQISSPRLLPLKGVGRVQQAACGGTQVAVLNDKGEVFVWGYGILGKGPDLSESRTPEMIPPSLFGKSEFNPAVTVTRIHCGLTHFAAITDRGELFVWGKNLRGCLGIGKRQDQHFPWRVTVPGQVVDVACGVDHMVALVRSLM
ncbi:RCC1-like G exchanging factor-like protein [Anguilla rostrata]|uniref:RCC1-like G exchanging factor-like protein n=1 Tax=Anguilla rostrata TaxID=7938 RepID=UPI0030CA7E3C